MKNFSDLVKALGLGLFLLSFNVEAAVPNQKNEVRYITQTVLADAKKVYAFASNPENLPKWASGLSSSITKSGDHWIAKSPMGDVKIKFADKNIFGVLDHDVTLPNGTTVHNPLRVVPGVQGSEIVFTLFRQPAVTDAEFDKDAATVAKDLQNLKKLVE